MESEGNAGIVEMVPGRGLLWEEGRVLRAKEELNHVDNEAIIHQLTIEPGDLFCNRRRRERLKLIRFSARVVIVKRLGSVHILVENLP
jgi:hypothetical protein